MLKRIGLALGVLLHGSVTLAADGDLDPSFGMFGKVTTSIAAFNDAASVAIQGDGKIVVAGTVLASLTDPPAMLVARYTTTGTLDTSFNGVGYVTAQVPMFGGRGRRVVVQSDGRILALGMSAQVSRGSSQMFLVRYETNGTPDATFGVGGMVEYPSLVLSAGDIALVSGGMLVSYLDSDVSFGVHTRVIRFTSAGVVDSSFGTAGIVEIPIVALAGSPTLAIRSDGLIIVAASNAMQATPTIITAFAAGRVTSGGAVDSSFGDAGVSPAFGDPMYVSGYAAGVALQADNRLVLAGESNSTFTLVGMGADGGLDSSFGSGGVLSDGFAARALAISAVGGGRFVVVGGDPQFAVARVTSGGALDATFGTGGKVTTSFGDPFSTATAMAVQADGAIVVVGNTGSSSASSIALARYSVTSCTDDADADGICDDVDECVVGGSFDPARLIVSDVQQPGCANRLVFNGILTVPSAAAVDPSTMGLRIIVRDDAKTVIVDETLAPGAYDNGTQTGWQTRASTRGTTWTFSHPSDGGTTKTRAVVRRNLASPDAIKILLKGHAACFAAPPAQLPLTATVVLTPPQALDERCGDARFPGPPGASCLMRPSGKIACR